MTREEMLKVLSTEYMGDSDTITEAKKMAIKIIQQEPCEDCISRQAVIDALCDGCELYHKNGEQTCLTKCEEYHFLITLPSIQPKAKWIPVSEKLPSDCNCDWVLAQIQEDNGYLWIPCVAEYRKLKDDWYIEYENFGWVKDHDGMFKVIAWSPLPEPYKAERGQK